MEETLSIRVGHLRPENGAATDEVNKEMANEIGRQVGIRDFVYITGWLKLFKQNLKYSEHIKEGKRPG